MAWYDAAWSYRHKITIDNTKVSATLTDFPVYVDLDDMPDAFFASVKSDGSDIRITQSNGTTEQAREVVVIDTSGKTGEIHFKGSSISSSTDTDFYIYYGNSGASEPAEDATYGRENTWDVNFKAVYHLQEIPEGTPPHMLDSTAGDNDGTAVTMVSGDSVPSQIEKGLDMDGTDYVDCNGNVTDPTNITLESWINVNAITAEYGLMGKRGSPTGNVGWYFGFKGSVAGDPLQFSNFGDWDQLSDASGIVADTWYHVAVTYNLVNIIFYIDGAELSSHARTTAIDVSSNNLFLGALNQLGTAIVKFNGTLDEMRISDTARSADWISAQYNNQDSPSTFYSVGAQESAFTPQIIIF
jgi:hypothetical protein